MAVDFGLAQAPSRTDIEKTAMMLVQGLFMGASHEVSVLGQARRLSECAIEFNEFFGGSLSAGLERSTSTCKRLLSYSKLQKVSDFKGAKSLPEEIMNIFSSFQARLNRPNLMSIGTFPSAKRFKS